MDGHLCCAKTFSFEASHLFPVSSSCLARGVSEHTAVRNVPDVLLTFPSGVLMVLSLTFRSRIHLERVLVCGVRRRSRSIFCWYLSNFPTLNPPPKSHPGPGGAAEADTEEGTHHRHSLTPAWNPAAETPKRTLNSVIDKD